MELLDGSTFYLPCKNGGHLPLVITTDTTISGIHFQDSTLFSSGSPCETFLSVTYQNNQNLRLSQKEVLLIHKILVVPGYSGFIISAVYLRTHPGNKPPNLLQLRLLNAIPHCVQLVRCTIRINAHVIGARLVIQIL